MQNKQMPNAKRPSESRNRKRRQKAPREHPCHRHPGPAASALQRTPHASARHPARFRRENRSEEKLMREGGGGRKASGEWANKERGGPSPGHSIVISGQDARFGDHGRGMSVSRVRCVRYSTCAVITTVSGSSTGHSPSVPSA